MIIRLLFEPLVDFSAQAYPVSALEMTSAGSTINLVKARPDGKFATVVYRQNRVLNTQ